MRKMGRRWTFLLSIISAICLISVVIGMNFTSETKSEFYDSPLYKVRSDAVSARVENTNVVNSYVMSDRDQIKFQYGYDLVSKMNADKVALLQEETITALNENGYGDIADIIGNIPTIQLTPCTFMSCKLKKVTDTYAWWDQDHDGILDQEELDEIGWAIIALTVLLGITTSAAISLFMSLSSILSPTMIVLAIQSILIGAGLIFIGNVNLPTVNAG